MVATITGITGGLHTTLPTAMVISAFTAIAWVNVIELQVRIWMTFKKRVGLYFWSLNVASWGVGIYAAAFIFKFFKVINNDLISCVFITIGWWSMVTGQSLVLYSRLHLLVVDRRKLRWILYMICIDAVIFHLPTTVLTFGVSSPSPPRHACTAFKFFMTNSCFSRTRPSRTISTTSTPSTKKSK